MLRYVHDDGGRAASGRKGKTEDCVIRAIAIAADADYREVYALVASETKSLEGRWRVAKGVPKKVGEKVLAHYGFEKSSEDRNRTYSDVALRHEAAVVSTTRHWCAIKGGALRDVCDDRTYAWRDESGEVQIRERKARSVYVRTGVKK